MKFKSKHLIRYLIMFMSLFLIVVFIDQNRAPVPVKILLGNPFHFGLSLIILISMAVAMVMTIGVVYYLMNRRKDK